MKTIGILGGMSWQSTQLYYRLINETVAQRLGGFHSAKIVMVSVDFADIEALQTAGDWSRAGQLLAQAAQQLERAGADCVLLATNTMHKVAEKIEQSINIPFLHIADATGLQLREQNIQRVALLGTAFTMSQGFYKDRLIDRFGLEVIVPNEAQQREIHTIIYEQLVQGLVEASSRETYVSIIETLRDQGAEQVILGCTEIGMLINKDNSPLPVLDTTAVHAQSGVTFALA